MAEDNMERIEVGNGTADLQVGESSELNARTEANSRAYDPEAAIEESQSALEHDAFERLTEALIGGTGISEEDALKISDAYSGQYYEGSRAERKRAASIVMGIIESFPDGDELREI